MASDYIHLRRDFWARYAELYPEDGVPAAWGRSFVWVPVDSADLNVSLALVHGGVALGLKGRKGESAEEAELRVKSHRDSFHREVAGAFNGRSDITTPATQWKDVEGGFDAKWEFDAADPENWQYMAEWLHHMLHLYLRVIAKTLVAQE